MSELNRWHADGTILDVVRLILTSGKGRAIRKAAGISTRQFSRDIGVSETSISKWELGRARPSKVDDAVRYLAKITDLLDQQKGSAA